MTHSLPIGKPNRHDGGLPVAVEPLTAEVARRAAALRARHRRLQLPDALVVATGRGHLDAARLITTDRRWPARSALKFRAAITRL
jgi:hypothetical protein